MMKLLKLTSGLMLALNLVCPAFADVYTSSSNDNSDVYPHIYFIEEGTEWDLEVKPAYAEEILDVKHSLCGIETVNGKDYIKLWSSINGAERKLISYIYIDGRVDKREVFALDPNNMEKGERLIYKYSKSGLKPNSRCIDFWESVKFAG